jgi:glycine/D-amino acid oxidase-like deaminating enzyme
MLSRAHYDHLVVGGGFYGAVLASELASRGRRVVLCERAGDLLQRASLNNQARVHNGYHYPRSLLTALRSRVNFQRFSDEFSPAIVSNFRKLYAVPRRFSKVSARQFLRFVEQIGAPIEPASRQDAALFDGALIEAVFSVVEHAFDAVILKQLVRNRLDREGVEVALNTEVLRLERHPDGLKVRYQDPSGGGAVTATEVLNCTYSGINDLLKDSGLPILRIKHELTEMALIEPPDELRGLGVTVMCGPFFSCMPYPARQLHSLSHVRYTPHAAWEDTDDVESHAGERWMAEAKISKYPHMVRASALYLPCLMRARYQSSLWEVKSVLPQSEGDDSRPILFRRDHGLPGLVCVMGGKLDNIYDALMEYHPGVGEP